MNLILTNHRPNKHEGSNGKRTRRIQPRLWTKMASAAPPPYVDINDDDLFNIVYSSGTTGWPKGIVHTHYVCANYCRRFAASWRMTPESVVMHMKLEGRVAIVSGSGRGIGRAVATKLAAEGASVVVNDLDEATARATATAIRDAGGKAAVCAGNVTEPDFGNRFVKTAIEEFGGLDIIVNNAGNTWDAVIQKMTDEQFQAIMDVHVTAPFRILRAAAEPIRAYSKQEAAEGRELFRKVVNISSVSGLGGNPGQVNYSAAKMAVVGMTKTLAKEWGRYKVNVNCVAFGFIRTRMTQPITTEASATGEVRKVGVQPALIEQLEQNAIPLGRLGTAEEAADGVYLFCSPESNYISGQVITVGGGITF